MRQNQGSKRSRGRGGNGRRGGGRQQTFDSNGPNVRIRGNAHQIHEKYLTLARDAGSSGDRVAAENYSQHAEHYFRLIAADAEQREQRNGQNNHSGNGSGNGNGNGRQHDQSAGDNQGGNENDGDDQGGVVEMTQPQAAPDSDAEENEAVEENVVAEAVAAERTTRPRRRERAARE